MKHKNILFIVPLIFSRKFCFLLHMGYKLKMNKSDNDTNSNNDVRAEALMVSGLESRVERSTKHLFVFY